MSERGEVPGLERCFACGGCYTKSEGSTHPYMLSVPSCWSAYGQLLAREYENPTLFSSVHRLTVDAYALQHPGDVTDRRATQSVWVHYAALHLTIEGGKQPAWVTGMMQRLAGRSFSKLPLCSPHFDITHADVLARPRSEHVAAVRLWASCAYDAWAILRQATKDMLATL